MNWFDQLPRRDQIVLIIGVFFVTVVLVWSLVLNPLADSVVMNTQQYENAKRDLAEVKLLVAEFQQYQSNQGSNPQSFGSLDSVVTKAINQNQLAITTKTPSGNDRLTIRFDNANYEDIIQWLYDLETGQGVQVENLSLTASGQPGFVMASVRLRRN